MDLKNYGYLIASHLGVTKPVIQFYDTVIGLDELPPIDSAIKSFKLKEEDKVGNVIFPTVQGQGVNAYFDYLLAHAFRTRGYEPTIILCDRGLDLCFPKRGAPNDKAACDVCRYRGESLSSSFGIKTKYMDEFGETISAYDSKGDKYRDIDIDQYAIASTRAFTKRFHIKNDGESTSILQRFRRSAKKITDVAYEVLENENYETVISNNSAYFVGGIFLDVAKQNNITAWDVGTGFKPQSLICGKNENDSSLPTYTDDSVIKKRLKRPLTKKEDNSITSFMEKRMQGKMVKFDHSKLGINSMETDESVGTYGLFTNLLWDASLSTNQSVAFEDVFKWVKHTISSFRAQGDKELYIKTHPAEVLRTTEESISEWILEDLSLPSNVHLLEPDTSINPYEFMRAIDTGVVWNSTAGLEMSYLGTPVIVAGDTHYRGYGFTYDANSPAEYDKLLDENLKSTDQTVTLAKRYAHLLFLERHIDFKFYNVEDGEFQLLPASHQKLEPGNNNIDVLIETLLEGSSIPEVRYSYK